jgi:hypothetical protein
VQIKTLAIKVGFCIFAAATVGSCATSSHSFAPTPVVNPASVVRINQELQIPVGKARVYLQEGAVLDRQRSEISQIYCSVLMQNVHKRGEPLLKVMPGRFEIKQLREDNDSGSTFWEWPSNDIYSVEMRLDSPGQPGVRALICAKRSGLNRSWNVRTYYPNLAEIRSALGDIIEIIEP